MTHGEAQGVGTYRRVCEVSGLTPSPAPPHPHTQERSPQDQLCPPHTQCHCAIGLGCHPLLSTHEKLRTSNSLHRQQVPGTGAWVPGQSLSFLALLSWDNCAIGMGVREVLEAVPRGHSASASAFLGAPRSQALLCRTTWRRVGVPILGSMGEEPVWSLTSGLSWWLT